MWGQIALMLGLTFGGDAARLAVRHLTGEIDLEEYQKQLAQIQSLVEGRAAGMLEAETQRNASIDRETAMRKRRMSLAAMEGMGPEASAAVGRQAQASFSQDPAAMGQVESLVGQIATGLGLPPQDVAKLPSMNRGVDPLGAALGLV